MQPKYSKMGIKNLNKFIREKCPHSINCISISELRGKIIAVDISIYIYKYQSEGTLLDNIYLMMTIFRNYGVIPIIVFDGKPPAEKKELLIKRKQDKASAKEEFNKLKEQLKMRDNTMSEQDKQEIISSMDILKKQFVSIRKEHVDNVKRLIELCGIMCVDAPGEADQMCASLVLDNTAWACMSDDMDMFVYGATRVVRYFSIMNHTVVLYTMNGILKELNMTQKEFREICVLSGTDYNIATNSEMKQKTLNEIYTIYTSYKKENIRENFYEWIKKQYSDYIIDDTILFQVYKMFCSESYDTHNIVVTRYPVEKEKIQELLETEGFFFP